MAACLTRLTEALQRHYFAVRSDDWLYRPCVYPLAFSGKPNFDQIKFWNLQVDGLNVETSLCWERFAPTLGYVHRYGCRLAKSMTSSARKAGKIASPSHLYCGSYRFDAGTVRSLKGARNLREIEAADVVHKIEKSGELAHAAFLVRLNQIPNNPETIKTAIIALLETKTSGPFKHVCKCDQDVRNHPSEKLPDGRQTDSGAARPLGRRLISLARFQFERAVWKTLLIIQALCVAVTKPAASKSSTT